VRPLLACQLSHSPLVQLPSTFLKLTYHLTEAFEEERADLLERVAKLSVPAAEQHRLEWEAAKRTDEIRELQKVCVSVRLLPACLGAGAEIFWHGST
jgi:hypothetical protein